jgi:hypothetical protein
VGLTNFFPYFSKSLLTKDFQPLLVTNMANAMLSGVSAYFLIKMYIEDYLLILPIYKRIIKLPLLKSIFNPQKF